MATFKDIQAANEEIKTMTITRWDKKQQKEVGKEYAEVNQRIKAFRMVYPEGFIETNIVSMKEGVVLMKAECGVHVAGGEKLVLGTGYAFEDQKASTINKTSFIENCETSAVGRALGMCGFGIDTSIASADEVSNAIAQQESLKNQPPTPEIKPRYQCEKCGTIFEDKAAADKAWQVHHQVLCPDCCPVSFEGGIPDVL